MTIKDEKKYAFKNTVAPILIGGLISIGVALTLILVFALVIRFADVPSVIITPINITIKTISIALGTLFATKNGEKGLVKGSCVGTIFILLAFIVFSIISKKFEIGASFLIDIGLGVVVGAITGVVFVNFRKQ